MNTKLDQRFMKTIASWGLVLSLVPLISGGCKSGHEGHHDTKSSSTATAAAPAAEARATASAPAPTPPKPAPAPIRIGCGDSSPYTDAAGNVWLADQGFADGETITRPDDLQIQNTKDPGLYRAERYSMTAFSHPLPNGKYVVKLHFAETYDGISGPGERVFSFNVEGQDFKNFDVWKKSGGFARAYIETVNVEVTDGKLDIAFTPDVENPEINGIEIIPAP